MYLHYNSFLIPTLHSLSTYLRCTKVMCISYRNSSDQHGDSSAQIQNPHDNEYPSEENPTAK